MQTIAAIVEAGINSIAELEDALKLAMQLEFATLPPYLCAEWSIDSDAADPDDFASVINNIAEQEMFHFALVGNILTGIGGTPQVATASFVPTYPTNQLPGGIRQTLPVDLKPLSKDQLRVFVQIEKPGFLPVAAFALSAATIGEFYTTIEDALRSLNPPFNPQAPAVTLGEVTSVRSQADALAAIDHIKEEGEGTTVSPDQSKSRPTLAHYYAFKEFLEGRRLKETAGNWHFDGAPIQLPKTFDFQPARAGSDASAAFNQTFTKLLKALQACWTEGALPDLGAMLELKTAGIALIKRGIRPEFKWDESA